MAFGVGGNDPFKSYNSNADAGGNMGVYVKRQKKNKKDEKDKKDEEPNSLLDFSDDQDDDNLIIEGFDDL